MKTARALSALGLAFTILMAALLQQPSNFREIGSRLKEVGSFVVEAPNALTSFSAWTGGLAASNGDEIFLSFDGSNWRTVKDARLDSMRSISVDSSIDGSLYAIGTRKTDLAPVVAKTPDGTNWDITVAENLRSMADPFLLKAGNKSLILGARNPAGETVAVGISQGMVATPLKFAVGFDASFSAEWELCGATSTGSEILIIMREERLNQVFAWRGVPPKMHYSGSSESRV